jgi:hypothetical protein
MDKLGLILLCFGFVAFFLDGFRLVTPTKINLVAIGLALWILTEILFGAVHVFSH